MDQWFTNQRIVFEPLAPYFEEENGMSEKTGQTIMEIVRAPILKRRIEVILWPKVVLAMTYIKNIQPTQTLEDSISPIEK